MSRKAGIASIKNKSLVQTKYKEKSDELAENQVVTLARQFEQIRQSLESYASKHGKQINENSKLRSHFQAMCSSIGVDPIAYSKGCWSEILGLGEFYYHLAIKIIEVCLANQYNTGGIMPLKQLVDSLNANRSRYTSEVTEDDVKRSIKKLKCLGTGFTLVPLPGKQIFVQSIPGELSPDHTVLLSIAEQKSGPLSVDLVMNSLEWSRYRAEAAFQYLMGQGMVWLDCPQSGGEKLFWFPSLFSTSIQ